MPNNSLNIAMLGHKHMLSREGGIEIVVKELTTRMAARGHNVTVYDRHTGHVSGECIEKRTEYKGVQIKEVLTIDKKGLAAMTASFFAALRAALGKYDVIHIHAEGPAAMCWLLKLFHKRVIVTVHGLDWSRAKWSGFATKYIKFGEKQAVKHADEIIVLSRGVQEYFKKTYDRGTVFIPNGVSKPEIREADEIKKLWGLEKDSYVLFLGRIVPEKGLRYLIEAYRLLHTKKKLVIVGGSSDTQSFMDELKEIASVDDRIIFTGFQQGRVLEELFSNAYVYVLPSDLEGMPLSLLEAMSYGNCCVVSDIAECTEVVEDKAVVFKHSVVSELKKALQQLLDCQEIVAKYKDDAAAFITAKYSWEDVVEKTLGIYRR